MPLPLLIKKYAEQKLANYCAGKIPEHVKDKVKLEFKIRGNNVTLFELRPAFGKPETWVDISVAQFRYNLKDNEWTLYCADRNSKWHMYIDLEPSENFDDLLQEVEEDPTGIFWG